MVKTFTAALAQELSRGWPHQRSLASKSSKKSPEERAAAVLAKVDPSGKKPCKAAALRWFVDHADFALTHREQLEQERAGPEILAAIG